jgi:hypothetical protein
MRGAFAGWDLSALANNCAAKSRLFSPRDIQNAHVPFDGFPPYSFKAQTLYPFFGVRNSQITRL